MTSTQPLTYLIVCCRYIGDVLVTTPLALSIKTAQPDAVVDYLVFEGTEGILAKNPHVRTVHTIPNKKASIGKLFSLYRQYDVAIAAYPSDRTVVAAAIAGRKTVGLTSGWRKEWWKSLLLQHRDVSYDRIHVVANILMPLRMLGIEPVPRMVVGYDHDDLAFAQQMVPFPRYIILHPYSMKNYKYWPAQKWASLAALIRERTGCVPLFTRTPEADGEAALERIRCCTSGGIEAIDRVCTLNQLAAIISRAAAFIGVDTAITHLAAAVDCPTVALFGPTLTRYWAPWPNGCGNQSVFSAGRGIQRHGYVTVVQKEWDCVPCNQESCAISRRGVIECLEQLGEDEVLTALMAVLDHGREVCG